MYFDILATPLGNKYCIFLVFCLCVLLFDFLYLFLCTSFSVNVYECFPKTHFSVFVLSLWTACITTRSFFVLKIVFPEEILQHNFSVDSNLDGLVASDEPAPRNSCAEELKQVVTEESIEDGRTHRIAQKQ